MTDPSQINNSLNQQLPTQGKGQITAAVLRGALTTGVAGSLGLTAWIVTTFAGLTSDNVFTGANTFTGTVTLPQTGILVGPCDIMAKAATPCAAAHSITRAMFSGYVKRLFQLTRSSDGTSTDIVATASGLYNAAAVATFCAGTNCIISKIYDQTANGNDLTVVGNVFAANATPGNAAPWTISYRNGLPVVLTYGDKGAYRNRATTSAIPTGAASSATFEVRGTDAWSTIGGGYGRMESYIASACGSDPDGTCPPGAMWATALSTYFRNSDSAPTTTTAPGPGVDQEFFVYTGVPATLPGVLSQFATWNNATGAATVNWGDATKPNVYQAYQVAPFRTPVVQSGLSLGEGGDASVVPEEFFEGGITIGAPTPATIAAVQANFAAFYGAQIAPVQTPTDALMQAGGLGGAGQLDPSAIVAGCWALRKCRNGYTGYAALVTRASDTTSLNVGFSATGDFDDQTAQAFCAGTTCYAKLYNQALLQSGNFNGSGSNDMTYTQGGQTLTQFPTLAFNALNGRTALAFNGGQIISTGAALAGLSTPLSVSWVGDRTGGVTSQSAVFMSLNGAQGEFGYYTTANTCAVYENGVKLVSATANDNTWNSIIAAVSSAGATLVVNNGTPATATGTTYGIANYASIGGNYNIALPFTGQIAEVMLATTALSSTQITALYQNQRAYYGNQF